MMLKGGSSLCVLGQSYPAHTDNRGSTFFPAPPILTVTITGLLIQSLA
jgi:hypothetical protein